MKCSLGVSITLLGTKVPLSSRRLNGVAVFNFSFYFSSYFVFFIPCRSFGALFSDCVVFFVCFPPYGWHRKNASVGEVSASTLFLSLRNEFRLSPLFRPKKKEAKNRIQKMGVFFALLCDVHFPKPPHKTPLHSTLSRKHNTTKLAFFFFASFSDLLSYFLLKPPFPPNPPIPHPPIRIFLCVSKKRDFFLDTKNTLRTRGCITYFTQFLSLSLFSSLLFFLNLSFPFPFDVQRASGNAVEMASGP